MFFGGGTSLGNLSQHVPAFMLGDELIDFLEFDFVTFRRQDMFHHFFGVVFRRDDLLKCFDFGCQFSFNIWHVNLDFSITPPKTNMTLENQYFKREIHLHSWLFLQPVILVFGGIFLKPKTSSTFQPCFFRPSNHRRLGSIKHKFRHMFVISGSRGML